ncbi:MAG TPA: ABC transporter substrate-binding protein [Candidatus Limnocylindria bacterium]|nr:ABC transporter substrate-binding protein [Candidatus Limnocylindria bacterium]
MKRLLVLLLAAALTLGASGAALAESADLSDLIAAAQAEGELVVYGSAEEAHVAAIVNQFSQLYGIKTSFMRLSTGEVQAKITEENGNPSADVWFGGTTDPYNEVARIGLLEAYEARNAGNLVDPMYRDKDGYWYGVYKGILGFMVNTEELARLGLPIPEGWDDLIKPEYKGLVWMSNPNTAGTAKLIINTMVQMKGHDEAMRYFVELDKNVAQYTKSGSGPSKKVGIGESVIGIGFLHDGITQILLGYDNIQLIIPKEGTSFEVGATAIFKGAKHPNAARLWIEYCLTPQAVNVAKEHDAYQFLVLKGAEQPKEATDFGLDPDNVIKYDFEDAKMNTSNYVKDFFEALGAAADDRFKTE